MRDFSAVYSPILAALLHGDDLSGELFAALSPQDFGQGFEADIFRAMKLMFDEGRKVNPLSLSLELNSVSLEADIGSSASQLEELFPVEAAQGQDLLQLANTVKAERLLTSYHDKAGELLMATDLQACERALEGLYRLSASGEGSGPVTSQEAATRFSERLNMTLEEKNKCRLSWGIEPLDEQLFVGPGNLLVVGARPSVGKTALSLQWALHMAQKWRVGFVSCETSADGITDRAMAHLSGVPLRKIKDPALLDKADWAKIVGAEKLLSSLSFDVLDKGNRCVADIRRIALAKRWEVVVIDYLQLLKGNGSSVYERVTDVSRQLQELAQSCGIAVIALSQLSRAGAEQPSMEALRDSGQIEQDADVVMLLSLEDANDKGGRRRLDVVKNRDGRLLFFHLDFYGDTQTMAYSGRKA